MNPAVMDITETAYNNTFQSPWLGTVDADRAWWWIDNFLILVRTHLHFIKPPPTPTLPREGPRSTRHLYKQALLSIHKGENMPSSSDHSDLLVTLSLRLLCGSADRMKIKCAWM